jgi:hypothetical protein
MKRLILLLGLVVTSLLFNTVTAHADDFRFHNQRGMPTGSYEFALRASLCGQILDFGESLAIVAFREASWLHFWRLSTPT